MKEIEYIRYNISDEKQKEFESVVTNGYSQSHPFHQNLSAMLRKKISYKVFAYFASL